MHTFTDVLTAQLLISHTNTVGAYSCKMCSTCNQSASNITEEDTEKIT